MQRWSHRGSRAPFLLLSSKDPASCCLTVSGLRVASYLLNGQIYHQAPPPRRFVCTRIPFISPPPGLLVFFSSVPLSWFSLVASLIPSSSSSTLTFLITRYGFKCLSLLLAFLFCMLRMITARCSVLHDSDRSCAYRSLGRRLVLGIECRWRVANISRDTISFREML